ncbi:MAG: vWA domain-containing protein [Myxococcota bacterium]
MPIDRVEALGPAERVLQTLLTHSDHLVHNRPGLITADPASPIGVRWTPVTHRVEGAEKVVYALVKRGAKSERVRKGVLGADNAVRHGGAIVGHYRKPGLFHESVGWTWRQIADVWRLDNEFAARWASWSFGQEHRDLKVALAAFMLVQSRTGQPVRDGDGAVLFHDEDFREVGEAMVLIRRKDGKDLSPKLLLRIGDVLELPAVAAINRECGFGKSARTAPLGRWPAAVTKWLAHRERNPAMLEGLVKAGFRTTVMELARRVGYKPATPAFFRVLRWKQKQAADGRRAIAIGASVAPVESWEGLSEAEVCERIVATRPSYKRLVGLLPPALGLTRAVVAAAVEAGALSDADLVIFTPTLEDLGLLDVPMVKARWESAVRAAENQRAAHIATRVKDKGTQERLVAASEEVVRKATVEVLKGLRVYFAVDISASMTHAIEAAKGHLAKLLGGFPLDRVHVSVFNTGGREVTIKHPSVAGVEAAFRGFTAGGGTDYGAGVRALSARRPAADEDVLFVFVGDEQAAEFSAAFAAADLHPVAFGFVRVDWDGRSAAVRDTAARMGIPCFLIDEAVFGDPYAVVRTLRNLIAATPVTAVTAPQRTPLVATILATELLHKPVWAA